MKQLFPFLLKQGSEQSVKQNKARPQIYILIMFMCFIFSTLMFSLSTFAKSYKCEDIFELKQNTDSSKMGRSNVVQSSSIVTTSTKPVIIIRPQTLTEAFNHFLATVKMITWYEENGYMHTLPKHPYFKTIYENSKYIDLYNKEYIFNIFENEIYKFSDYDDTIKFVSENNDQIVKMIDALTYLNKQWEFKIYPVYEIVVNKYGPAGMYNTMSGNMKIFLNTSTTENGNKIKTIGFMMVIAGIHNLLFQQYKLSHYEKIRVSELIGEKYLAPLFPYLPFFHSHPMSDRRIDEFVTKKSIKENLPAAIRRYVKKYPR